ncbi:hypothetical protein G3N57_28225 [Paraburkholderia sp. Se-20369]|nr:hypothetical protein [Paraburkholderia sp. Se-20369]
MRFQLWICATLSFFLAGCATNLSSVSTFANSASSVASETNTVFSSLPDTCTDFESLFRAEYNVGSSALAHAKTTKQKIHPAIEQAAQNAVNGLQPVRQQVRDNCTRIEKLSPALQLLNQALSNYASGLKSLSQDQFVTYNPALDSLPQSLAGFKKPDGSSLITTSQVQAVDSLQKLIYSAAIQSYRQKKLSSVLNDDTSKEVSRIVDALKNLAGDYMTQLKANQQLALQTKDFFSVLQSAGYYFEPIAQENISTDMAAMSVKNEAQQHALNQYVVLLDKLMPAFKAAQSSVQSPSEKDVAIEIKDFSKSAYDTAEALKKAF